MQLVRFREERGASMAATTAPKAAKNAAESAPLFRLEAAVAADLMVANPISLRATAGVREALALLTDKNFSAAPVIDEAGHPVGVLSRSDLLVHDREQCHKVGHAPAYFYEHEVRHGKKLPEDFEIEEVDESTVGDLMTPAVFSVPPDTPAARVISEMVALHVHRLFVVDKAGTLVGVISTMDILKRLRTA
jgi:CBS domain-containing protein